MIYLGPRQGQAALIIDVTLVVDRDCDILHSSVIVPVRQSPSLPTYAAVVGVHLPIIIIILEKLLQRQRWKWESEPHIDVSVSLTLL